MPFNIGIYFTVCVCVYTALCDPYLVYHYFPLFVHFSFFEDTGIFLLYYFFILFFSTKENNYAVPCSCD